ncbi:MAG: Rrf2 family transcriptional regulator [Deltaproteobacteria bacterium]|nr:Rrf2 family transcriptional regulator [Deltaproteobacteria bacterium]
MAFGSTMVLSQTAEYALRAMAWLATMPAGELMRVKDLSIATGIPSQYLSKVMRRLVLAGLLFSQKGQGGGLTLSKPPGEIPFIDILSAVDAFPADGHCTFCSGECDEVHPCSLRGAWSRLNEQLRSWAKGTTLADVARDGVENREQRMETATI